MMRGTTMSNKTNFKVSTFFSIEKTKSHDTGDLKYGNEYDYVTRSVLNRGIIRTTSFVDADSLNESNVFSLELLNLTFFFRERKWYAGQFIRKVVPLFPQIVECWEYFEGVLSGISKMLRNVLIRDVDTAFLSATIELPYLSDNDGNPVPDESKQYSDRGFIPDWESMKKYISDAHKQFLRETTDSLKKEKDKYYLAAGITDSFKPTPLKANCLVKQFYMEDLFDIFTGRDVIISETKPGPIPLVSHTNVNNGISKRIEKLDNRILFNHLNTISLADRGLFWASTQDEDFHIGTRVKALVLKDGEKDKNTLLYLVAAINGLQREFDEYLINATNKLPTLKIWLPVLLDDSNVPVIDKEKKNSRDGYIPDWDYMSKFIENSLKTTIDSKFADTETFLKKAEKYIKQTSA